VFPPLSDVLPDLLSEPPEIVKPLQQLVQATGIHRDVFVDQDVAQADHSRYHIGQMIIQDSGLTQQVYTFSIRGRRTQVFLADQIACYPPVPNRPVSMRRWKARDTMARRKAVSR
jgi:hypothetical protein